MSYRGEREFGAPSMHTACAWAYWASAASLAAQLGYLGAAQPADPTAAAPTGLQGLLSSPAAREVALLALAACWCVPRH